MSSDAGTNGTNGSRNLTTTLTTEGDMLYRDGSGLQRLLKQVQPNYFGRLVWCNSTNLGYSKCGTGNYTIL